MGKTIRNDEKHDSNTEPTTKKGFTKKSKLKKFITKQNKRVLKDHFMQHVWPIANENKKGPKI